MRQTRGIPGRSASPTARALQALELIQASPGITADQLGARLGVTGRAARRYVAILREADLPIESVSGPYGGYRVGRGMRLPPLMFSAAEATGLVMATLAGHRDAADPGDLVGAALAKILRALPARVADPVRGVVPRERTAEIRVSPEITGRLLGACTAGRRVRLAYRSERGRRAMDVDPWAVLLRHGRWYLLGWSHTAGARRILRMDRVAAVEELPESFEAPTDLDPVAAIEEHLSEGWTHKIEVVVDAPIADVKCWVPRKLARLVAIDEQTTRLLGSTDELDWYAERLAGIPRPFRVVKPVALREQVAVVGRRMLANAGAGTDESRAAAGSGPA